MTQLARKCRYCKRWLVPKPVIKSHSREHCGSPTCDWCLECIGDRVRAQ